MAALFLQIKPRSGYTRDKTSAFCVDIRVTYSPESISPITATIHKKYALIPLMKCGTVRRTRHIFCMNP